MNKLYVIIWKIKDDFEINRSCFWNPNSAMEKMKKNPEWNYTLVENNNTHMIWEAK